MIRAVLILAAAAGRTMQARGTGMIINVSSTAGFVTMGLYSAIKAWVTTYSEALANELSRTASRVTALCPGFVRTEFHQRASIRTGGIPSLMWVDLERHWFATAWPTWRRGKVISMPTAATRC